MDKVFLISFVLISFRVSAQKELLIRPYLGLQTGFWYNHTKPVLVDTRRNWIEVGLDIGIGAEYKLNNRFGLNAGAYSNVAANGYSFLLKTDCRQKNIQTSWNGAGYTRFGVGVDYVLSKKISRPELTDRKHRIILSISGGMGVSTRAYEDLNSGSGTSFYAEDTCGNYAVGVKEFVFDIKETTASLWVRPWIKLYRKGKERAAFSFIFNQGLTHAYSEEVTYEYNGIHYSFINKTRGTTFGINLSFPIIVKRWKIN